MSDKRIIFNGRFFLGKYKNKDLWYAVTYWVKHNDNAPTIRNLLEMMGDK